MRSTTPTVLMVTAPDEPSADAVLAELAALPVRAARIDLGDFPTRMSLHAATSSDDGWASQLVVDDIVVDLDSVRSVYYWRPTRFRFGEGMSAGDAAFAEVEARLGLGGVLASLDACWVNDPARVAVAEYKPLQLHTARRAGLTIPRTLITNDYSTAVEFIRWNDAPVVCKTLSSLILTDSDGHPHITYTTPIRADDLDPQQVAATAHQFQAQVPKAFDARVTMVGHDAFAVAIDAATDRAHIDWRADYDALTYRPIDVPDPIVKGMIDYLDAFGLSYGAFDFVVTPDDEWVMLECNPAGQWLWLAEHTGLPIAAALAGFLATGGQR